MNDIDILRVLASNLTERKHVAALSNYKVLCSNILFSHDLLCKGVNYLSLIISDIKSSLVNNQAMNHDFQSGNELNSFSLIVPSLLSNDLEALNKLLLLTAPDNRIDIDVNNVGELHKGFVEYNNLVTATRQFIDSLVTDAYQLQMLNPKEFNYHALLSLNSFEKYATKSIRQGLFNDEIEEPLKEFRKLKFKDWKKSNITQCLHPSFSDKVDYLFSKLNRASPEEDNFKDDIKNLFKFSSEFTHIGYISTFFTSQSGSQPIFGSDQGPYLPSTENFNELKYQILESCITFMFILYIPIIKNCTIKMLSSDASHSKEKSLDNLVSLLEHGIKTRNKNYFFFVLSSLIGSSNTIELPCLCNHVNHWESPHSNSDLYCISCGSSYTIIEVNDDSSYIITSNGPIRVIGSKAPYFKDLPIQQQQKMLDEVAKLNENNH